MKLSEILKDIEYEILQGNDNIEIEALSWDSRSVGKNSLFICVKNKNIDRHSFAIDATSKGAIALLIEEDIDFKVKDITIVKAKNTRRILAEVSNCFYGEPTKHFNLIGITGTNGKTSISYYIKRILEKSLKMVGIIGTIENTIGNEPLKTRKLNPTTPDALELQESFSEMLSMGATDVIMEVTSSALVEDRVHKCDFNVGVFTNLTQEHLEVHGTFENYKKAKMKLFDMCDKAVLNIDDPVTFDILRSSKAKKLTYGIKGNADIMAENLCYNSKSTSFNLCVNKYKKRVTLKIPGEFSVYNALAAVGACYLSGLSLDEIVSGLEAIEGVDGRFQVIPAIKDFKVIIDYAHSPDALKNVLKTAKEINEGNLISVFGCGGDRDKAKRPIMGEIAGRLSDICILTSDNPRSETPENIIKDIELGVKNTNCRYEKIENRRLAIYRALSIAKCGDTVLIAGKGHETYQIYGDTTIHFDDKEIVENYLKEDF